MESIQVIKGGVDPENIHKALIHKHDVEIPEPKRGDVRIKVFSAALNPVDWKQVKYQIGIENKFPHTLGIDVAGIVDKIGPNTDCSFRIGERVVYQASARKKFGGFAEYSITNVASLVRIPNSIKMVDAASVPTAGYTAYKMIIQKLRVEKHHTLVICGISGGVGTFGVQLAKNIGCTVIGICSGDKAGYSKSFGADYIIDYKTEDVQKRVMEITNGKGCNRWMDCVGSTTGNIGLKCLAYEGELACIADGPTEKPEMEMLIGSKSIHWVFVLGAYFASKPKLYIPEVVDIGNKMNQMIVEKKIRTFVSEEILLNGVIDGLKRVAQGKVIGKLMVQVRDEKTDDSVVVVSEKNCCTIM
eukprot:TRINITY_DN111507_c0_g1_i1.p1 TRINITY_DN111507_c0_g1~~TRINITY_DN111507_c0_g1_i1.p1  ORF type:complete len:358 (-),score=86.69 TRINITY_DN111507_c0_g1_i1:188-1261(-)